MKLVVYPGFAGFAFPMAIVGFQLRYPIASLGKHGLHLGAADPVLPGISAKAGEPRPAIETVAMRIFFIIINSLCAESKRISSDRRSGRN